MFHYLFTNDLRISTLDSSLKKAGTYIMNDNVPTASENKSENNNINTLAFYFNLYKGNNCAIQAEKGNIRAVVLNFIKKFQFPNMRTSTAFSESSNDKIILAPMRTIVKVLYLLTISNNADSAYLTTDEIKTFIFYNEKIAKNKNFNIFLLIDEILEYRKSGVLPADLVINENEKVWKHEDRQLREMLKVLVWAGCVQEEAHKFFINNDTLTRDNKSDIFDIINYNEFWYGTDIDSYKKYMDIDNIEADDSDNKSESAKNKTNLTPEWFYEKSKDFPDYDEKAEVIRKQFINKYSVEELEKLTGKEVLTKIFLNDENKENLCYELEFNNEMREYFGSIKSGTSYKYGLHYSKKNGTWATGSHLKPMFISEEAAIEVGTQIRDCVVAGAKILSQIQDLESVKDYLELYEKLYVATDGYINKIWVAKYYQMLKPELFPPIYSSNAQQTVCNAIGIEPDDNILCRMAQIRFYANECSISNILFSKVFWTYAVSQINDESVGDNDMSGEKKEECLFDSQVKSKYINLIVYGTPGCGKSWHVKNVLLKDYKTENVIRTTFYQDYTNTDFVGQIMPVVTGEDVTYKFNPGPFTLALRKAIEVPNEPVALVIEELNRGNAPSIFGDIFQLLDRENGKSEYQITNVNIQKYLADNIPNMEFNCTMLPANLSIIATMNTSDQNVFTLDTAFKRRWDFKKLKNRFKDDHPYKDYFVPGMDNTTWKMFVEDINNFIEDSSDLQSEDKQLGVFFVSEELLCKDVNDITDELKEKFAYKVLEYLWDDVAKFERDNWFNSNIKSLDKLVEEYVKSGKEVFKDGIFGKHTS